MAMMFAESFYTFKVIPLPEVLRSEREVGAPETALEKQIYAHVVKGHQAFFKAQYQTALSEYLAAWALLPRVIEPVFPIDYARLRPDILLRLELEDSLTEAAFNLLQVRGMGFTDPLPYLALTKLPEQIDEVLKEAGQMGVVELPDPAERLYNVAITQARVGQLTEAQQSLDQVVKNTQDASLHAAAASASGVLLARMGKTPEALRSTSQAIELYQQAGDAEGIGAAHNNMALIHQQQGDARQAASHLQQAAMQAPLAQDRTVVQLLDAGATTQLIRPLGASGLKYQFRNNAGKSWSTIEIAQPAAKPQQVGVLIGKQVASIPFNGDGLSALRAQVYDRRVTATSLSELRTYEEVSIVQFVSYLTHVWGYVLPIALGDAYYELGQYDKAMLYYTKARDYRFLNLAIEMPALWRRMGQTLLDHARLLYKGRDMAGAQALLEQIVQISGANFVLTGVMYSGAFASMAPKVLAFLQAADYLGFPDLSYDIRIVLFEALVDLRRILANINWLGFPDDIIPIYTFEYLQNVARYFADYAIQAERTFVSFKTRQEDEEATRHLLEDAVAVEEASLKVEERRVASAQAQRDATQANADLAQKRLDNADATLDDYDKVSWQLQELDASLALANSAANDTEVEVTPGRAAQLGIESGTYEARYYAKLLTQRRNQVNRAFEERNMQRQRDELAAAKAAADAQVVVADTMIALAEEQKKVSELRLENAKARLQSFDDELFTPELWDNLAREMRDIARQYQRWAISAAFLMERAFEVEHDREVNRISFDYERNDLAGLLGADFLKRDIDSFTYELLLETQKRIPMKEVISLSERYPFQFYRQLQKTGRMDFDTHMIDFDRRYPGTHLRKIKRVEVIVDGLIPPEGLHGSLTNSGTSRDRDRQGQPFTRVQTPETMLLSRFALREDSLIFPPQGPTLQLFEGSGVATGWILDIPPSQNNVDYLALVDVKLVIHYEAFFSDVVAALVKAELAAEPNTYSIGFGLAFEFPEAFFELQDSGQVNFTIGAADLPYNQTDPRITNLTVILVTEAGAPHDNIEIAVTATGAGVSVADRTDASGQIAADPGGAAPLNGLLTHSLLDTWQIRIDQAANAAAFANGFSWAKVSNIFFWVEYDFTPRSM